MRSKQRSDPDSFSGKRALMNILFIHQNFPGQFVHLATDLTRVRGNRVVALTMNDRPAPAGITVRRYQLLRPAARDTHPLLREQESQVLRAEACAAAALQLQREGFRPDIIVAHPGWGEALFMKDAFPLAKLVIYCEFYYASEGQDVGFDPNEPPLTFQQRAVLRLKNTTNLHSLQIADAAIAPTEWQRSTYPEWARQKISVIHEGIDFARLVFNPAARICLQDGSQLAPGDEVLTYVARNLEPIRGFDVFMQSLPSILHRRPHAHVIIAGGDEVSYGRRAPSGESWRAYFLSKLGEQMDLSRLHFLGKVPAGRYLDILSVSRVHAYWTAPFVLSWSFLEASISGVPVVASDTPPVREFADELETECLPFHQGERFADILVQHLADPAPRHPKHPQRLHIPDCLRRQRTLLNSL